MKLRLLRFASLAESTIGALYIDDAFSCFALEDQVQTGAKVMAETRIPAGLYPIKLRTVGKMHAKYTGKFPEHRGMLWLQDVPGFEYVLLHIGNTDKDSAGCILVGDGAVVNGELIQSTQGYRRMYGQVLNAIQAGEPVEINIEDSP